MATASTCSELRGAHIHVPVHMLTGTRYHRLRASTTLDAGADDYLVKPFAFAELSRASVRSRVAPAVRRELGAPAKAT